MTIEHRTTPLCTPTCPSAPPGLRARLAAWRNALGPGLITGASDDDPSGIGTYAMAGAAYGFATLWTALFTAPLMAGVQIICARIGLATGRGLAAVLAERYPRPLVRLVVLALLVANTINAGADLGAIAEAVGLVVPGAPAGLLTVLLGGVLLAFQLVGSYTAIARTLRWLTAALFAYIAAALLARPDAGEVVRGALLPSVHLDANYLAVLVAILGTTISPYLFFWQSNLEAEEVRRFTGDAGYGARRRGELAADVVTGVGFSNLVMFFVIMAAGATLYAAGVRDINTAGDAAQALRPLAGDAAGVVFALGLVGSGLLAVPVLTSTAGYAVAEAFAWNQGLDERVRDARGFYAVIAGSTAVGAAINFSGINPMDALFWTAVINGLLAPPLLALIVATATDRRLLGGQAVGPRLAALGWFTTAVMAAAAVAFLCTALPAPGAA